MAMVDEDKYTRSFELESAEGCTVRVRKYMSGLIASQLQAKKTIIYGLYAKAGIADNSTPEWHKQTVKDAGELSLEHDLLKVISNIHSWDLNENAFTDEPIDLEVTEDNVKLLRHEVLAEINDLIDRVQEAYASSKTVDKKNETLRSTNSPTATSQASSSIKRRSGKSTMTLMKPR